MPLPAWLLNSGLRLQLLILAALIAAALALLALLQLLVYGYMNW